jgi:glycosyltransferase involved in cell wall biosynthesis
VALVGRVEFRQKRQNVVVQHLHQLFAGLDRATLLIVGDGPDLHDLETLAAASPLAGRIRLAGWRDDVLDILQASDVLLLPSAYEGMPLTMLEALAMGIPVIASDVDGMSDMLPPEYLFPADSPARMHDVLVRVLSGYRDHLDELRRACSQMTLEVFRTHFAHAITTLLSLTEDGITNA